MARLIEIPDDGVVQIQIVHGDTAVGVKLIDLSDYPTVDAVPVVHGRWIPIEYDGYADGNPVWDLWECSECQEEHGGDEDTLTPYCPNCGAKMDGGAEDGAD